MFICWWHQWMSHNDIEIHLSHYSVVRHVGYAVIFSFKLLLQKCIRRWPFYTTVNYTENTCKKSLSTIYNLASNSKEFNVLSPTDIRVLENEPYHNCKLYTVPHKSTEKMITARSNCLQLWYAQTNTIHTYYNILSIHFWKPMCTHRITQNSIPLNISGSLKSKAQTLWFWELYSASDGRWYTPDLHTVTTDI